MSHGVLPGKAGSSGYGFALRPKKVDIVAALFLGVIRCEMAVEDERVMRRTKSNGKHDFINGNAMREASCRTVRSYGGFIWHCDCFPQCLACVSSVFEGPLLLLLLFFFFLLLIRGRDISRHVCALCNTSRD